MTTTNRIKNRGRAPGRHPREADGGAARRAEIMDTNANGMTLWKQFELPGVDSAVCIFERAHPIGAYFWKQGAPILGDASLRFAGINRVGLAAFCASKGLTSVAETLLAPPPEGAVLLVVFAADGVATALLNEFAVTNTTDGGGATPSVRRRRISAAPVTQRALVGRIQRKLAHDGLLLRAARGAGVRFEVGDRYIVDVTTGGVVESHVDLEELGRELGVLGPEERAA
jgi:hypothetical protein